MSRLKYLFSAVALMVAVTAANAQEESFQTQWGDQGDGTYINPVLNADYSDPDVIRLERNIIWSLPTSISWECRSLNLTTWSTGSS